jgi:hypothetical protein
MFTSIVALMTQERHGRYPWDIAEGPGFHGRNNPRPRRAPTISTFGQAGRRISLVAVIRRVSQVDVHQHDIGFVFHRRVRPAPARGFTDHDQIRLVRAAAQTLPEGAGPSNEQGET